MGCSVGNLLTQPKHQQLGPRLVLGAQTCLRPLRGPTPLSGCPGSPPTGMSSRSRRSDLTRPLRRCCLSTEKKTFIGNTGLSSGQAPPHGIVGQQCVWINQTDCGRVTDKGRHTALWWADGVFLSITRNCSWAKPHTGLSLADNVFGSRMYLEQSHGIAVMAKATVKLLRGPWPEWPARDTCGIFCDKVWASCWKWVEVEWPRSRWCRQLSARVAS